MHNCYEINVSKQHTFVSEQQTPADNVTSAQVNQYNMPMYSLPLAVWQPTHPLCHITELDLNEQTTRNSKLSLTVHNGSTMSYVCMAL